MDAVIPISPDDKLLLPCYYFVQSGVPINGKLYDLYRQPEVIEAYRLSFGKQSVCEGFTVWCVLVPSFFKGVNKYWWLNQLKYASEFLARKQFLQRA
ncbi:MULTISPECIES: hypothetical protein [Floridanema]|uniref:Uncharacterized protein n=2 Tax=Floridanema TaxID=3396149 RepID=A0ABV4X7W3_9CYAN